MSVTENLNQLRVRVEEMAQKAGRDPASVRLMAVSKGVEAARMEEALKAGQRLFGENYVQEAKAKWPELRARYFGIELHLIGGLQTNKAKDAVALFDSIDTLDRPELAEALAREMQKQKRKLPVFIEVNIGFEAQKHGCAPEALAALLGKARGLGLTVKGLMTVPPLERDPAPYFRECAALTARHHLKELSLGMSGDFEAAITCGSTLVRLGTAVFGERKSSYR